MITVSNQRKLIRLLSSVSLLIFFLPFFQTCSDKSIREDSFIFKSYSGAKTEKEKELSFQEAKKSFTLSGYDLAMSFTPIFSGFTLTMIINIILFVCFYRGCYNQLFMCYLNTFVILLSFIILLFTLPNLGQIRYGLCLSLINSFMLLYFVYREKEIPELNGNKKSL